MADPLSIAEFAGAIKKRIPQLADVPDDVLTRKILDRRPDLITKLTQAPSAPSALSAPQDSFLGRALGRVESTFQGAADMPGKISSDARARFQTRHPEPMSASQRLLNLPDAARSAFESVYYNAVEPSAAGLYNVSTPGLVGRVSAKEDPATIAADMATLFATGGEEPVKSVLEGGAKLVNKGLSKVGGATRILGQEMAGAGKEPVFLERIKRAATEKERLSRYIDDVTRVGDENTRKTQEHATKVKEAQDAYQKELAEYQKSTGEKRAAHAEKLRQLRQDWVDRAYEAKRLRAQSDSVKGQLDTIKRAQDAYAKIIKTNVESTHAAVKADLDRRWAEVNETVGSNTPINSVAIQDAIEEAKEKYLMGAPESLKVFNDLTKQMQGPEQIDTAEGITPATRPLTWSEGRVHYSALGDKMYSGELPGNVYHALGAVRDALDQQLSSVAKARGAGKMYSAVRADWSRYMDDWRDMRSLAVGGSPLARVMKAQDPGFVAAQITGKAGERMASTLGRYQQFGGNAGAVSKYRALGDRAKALPKVRVPEAPAKLSLPAEPKAGEAPEPKTVKEPQYRSAPRVKATEPVDPIAVRREKLTEMAGRPFRFYDLFPPYLIEHLAVKNPAIREWLARQSRQELPLP